VAVRPGPAVREARPVMAGPAVAVGPGAVVPEAVAAEDVVR